MFGRKRKAVDTFTPPIYRFLGTRQPTAGAMRFAFVSMQGLPASLPFGNGRQAGWVVQNAMHVLQSPQVYQMHGTTQQGYGGVIAGQFFTQPLISQG